jgi:hypothetical protein
VTRRIIEAFSRSLLLAGTLAVVLPAAVVFFNQEAFGSFYGEIRLRNFVFLHVSLATLIGVFSLVLPQTIRPRLFSFAIVFVLLLIVYPPNQLVFIPEAHGVRFVISYAIVGAAGLWICRAIAGRHTLVYAPTTILCLFSYGLIYHSSTDLTDEASGRVDEEMPYVSLGSEENVFILLFDAYTGAWFDRYIQANPEVKAELVGFDFYRNFLSPVLSTPYALPMLFEGSVAAAFENETLFANVNSSDALFFDFIDRGYSAFYSHQLWGGVTEEVTSMNEMTTRIAEGHDRVRFVDFMSISLERIVPRGLAAAIVAIPRLGQSETKLETVNNWSEMPIPDHVMDVHRALFRSSLMGVSNLVNFINEVRIGSEKKKLFFFHVLLPHAPLMYAKSGFQDARTSYDDNSEYATALFLKLIERLKRLGAYDDTAIVILSDHGFGSARSDSGRGWVGIEHRHNAMFMLKGFDAAQPFEIRDNLLELQEVRQGIANVLFNNRPSSSLGRALPATATVFEFQENPWKAYAGKQFFERKIEFAGDFSVMERAPAE